MAIVTSLGNGPMDSVQVGKAVFVKEDYTTLGIEPRTQGCRIVLGAW